MHIEREVGVCLPKLVMTDSDFTAVAETISENAENIDREASSVLHAVAHDERVQGWNARKEERQRRKKEDSRSASQTHCSVHPSMFKSNPPSPNTVTESKIHSSDNSVGSDTSLY